MSLIGGFPNEFWLALLSIPIAAAIQSHQRWLERRSRTNATKQELYRSYLRCLGDDIGHIGNSDATTETRFEIVRLRMELLCVASDPVVRQLEKVSDAKSKLTKPGGPDRYMKALAQLVKAMRQDGFPGTKIREEDMRTLLPFSINKVE